MVTRVTRLAFALFCLAHTNAKKYTKPCPTNCECETTTECKFVVRCEQGHSLPEFFPPGTDCVAVHVQPPTGIKTWSRATKEKFFYQTLPPNIKFLDLSFSNLGPAFPNKPFSRFHRLIFLSLEFNSLTALDDPTLFQGLHSLRTLWLTGNHIEPDEEMYPLAMQQRNQIARVHEALFQPLQNTIEIILLHHNNLTTINSQLFGADKVPELKVLKLLDNDMAPNHIDALKKALHDSWSGKRRMCGFEEASQGDCVQLDLRIDAGDDLEDLWEAHSISLVDKSVMVDTMKTLEIEHGGNKRFWQGRPEDRTPEELEELMYEGL